MTRECRLREATPRPRIRRVNVLAVLLIAYAIIASAACAWMVWTVLP